MEPGTFAGGERLVQRVERILKDRWYQEYLLRNATREAKRRFCRHNFQHMLDVARVAYILLLEAGDLQVFVRQYSLSGREAAREIIYAAGLLHDIGRWEEYDHQQDHAAASARLAKELMSRTGFTPLEIDIVTRAIGEHRRRDAHETLLGRYLHAADRLSRPCLSCPVQADCHWFADRRRQAYFTY
jgi:HD superfamily phosphodiesterase